MISDKKLKKIRTEALVNKEVPEVSYAKVVQLATYLDVLSQELMDIKLLMKKADHPEDRKIRSSAMGGGP